MTDSTCYFYPQGPLTLERDGTEEGILQGAGNLAGVGQIRKKHETFFLVTVI